MQLYTRILISAGIGLGSAAAASVGFAQQVLRHEPPLGLHYGSVFLVDDGTCGKGKIKKIVAGRGTFTQVGRVLRKRTCIPRSEMKPS